MAKKHISIIDKRKWLEQYESGKPEFKIAKSTKRDVRTIKKAIEDFVELLSPLFFYQVIYPTSIPGGECFMITSENRVIVKL